MKDCAARHRHQTTWEAHRHCHHQATYSSLNYHGHPTPNTNMHASLTHNQPNHINYCQHFNDCYPSGHALASPISEISFTTRLEENFRRRVVRIFHDTVSDCNSTNSVGADPKQWPGLILLSTTTGLLTEFSVYAGFLMRIPSSAIQSVVAYM